MTGIIQWFESLFNHLPLPLLEVWGRFGYIVGFVLMISAFSGLTFRPGGRWGFGRERQSWDGKALLSMGLTFILIFVTGYIGSFIVLVPGAQTFESLKDLSVFLCIVLFGYPALIAVPFAYGLSDLIEGVPPSFLLDWLVGYFINPACFWVAYQLIGKNPDFRRLKNWGWYLVFVFIFMSIEPQLWGYICSGKFTSEISYRNITPALFFTTSITWIISPFVMLVCLPLARKYKMFWAEIPGHTKERIFGYKDWVWESGLGRLEIDTNAVGQGLPIRMFIVTPFILFVLIMVGFTAYLTLSSSEATANKLAGRLHQEIAENINLQLDDYLAKPQNLNNPESIIGISPILAKTNIASQGRAFVIDRAGKLIASSKDGDILNKDQKIPIADNSNSSNSSDSVVYHAIQNLYQNIGNLETLKIAMQFKFDIVTAKPLSRETWLMQAIPYQDNTGRIDWIVITVMPAGYYLEGVRAGNSQSAMVFAISLVLSLLIAALLGGVVTTSIRRISSATQAMAKGDLTQRVPGSRLEELGVLSSSFNFMAKQLQESFNRTRASEERFRELAENIYEVFWITDPAKSRIIYISPAYETIWGRTCQSLYTEPRTWIDAIHTEDRNAVIEALKYQADGTYDEEYRIIRPDGTIRWIRDKGFPIQNEFGYVERIVGVARDITNQKRAEETILDLNSNLEKKIDIRTEELKKSNSDLVAAVFDLEKIMKELKEAQSQLLLSEKLATLGQLAAGMTHELNTPLGAIVSSNRAILDIFNTEVKNIPAILSNLNHEDIERFKILLDESIKYATISESLPDRLIKKNLIQSFKKSGIKDYENIADIAMDAGIYRLGDKLNSLLNTDKSLEILSVVASFSMIVRLSNIISIATGKASHVVGALKNYLNPGGAALQEEIILVDIKSEIETILTLYHSKIKYGVEVKKVYETNERCLGNPDKLNQVWINLLNNSLQSMSYKGKLEIKIEKKDAWIITSFIDTGIGIPEEIQSKVFEPFFTTKKHGEGIGLGLDICKKIIDKMDGKIEFESIPGRTKFSVWLKSADSI